MALKKRLKLTELHDHEAAIKYLAWNKNQWISFDDEITLKAKVKFANEKG
jgi:chitinase